jgi:hypothetical protein
VSLVLLVDSCCVGVTGVYKHIYREIISRAATACFPTPRDSGFLCCSFHQTPKLTPTKMHLTNNASKSVSPSHSPIPNTTISPQLVSCHKYSYQYTVPQRDAPIRQASKCIPLLMAKQILLHSRTDIAGVRVHVNFPNINPIAQKTTYQRYKYLARKGRAPF